jgi:hypothetical protein
VQILGVVTCKVRDTVGLRGALQTPVRSFSHPACDDATKAHLCILCFKRKESGVPDAALGIVSKAGHHLYLDNSKESNRALIS